MSEARGVYSLSRSHTLAIQSLCGQPEVAAVLGLPSPASEDVVSARIDDLVRAREAGTAYFFVLSAGASTLGICGLDGVGGSGPPTMLVAIGRKDRGNGHGAFAAARVLEVAFENLRLDKVRANANGDPTCARYLAQLGFVTSHESAELTRRQWQDARNRPALGALHPALSAILAAELAAGNAVAELRTGWPDADSVFVRLREPFMTRPSNLPVGIQYAESNDPHWWKSEYSSERPRHLLTST